MNSTAASSPLRLVTYLVPHLPLPLFQVYQQYLEEALGLPVTLMVESRWSKPAEGGDDPFTQDQADIGFLHTLPFLQLAPSTPAMELLPVAPVHEHPRGHLEPVHFADVIVHADCKERFSDFVNLHGYRCGFSHDRSVSSNLITQRELRKMATDNTFFGETVITGSDIASIERVLQYDLDAAVVDSNCLAGFLAERPEYKPKVKVVTTWGPIPIQPIVVNSKLPEELKQKVTKAFLAMNESAKWQAELKKFAVWGFKPSSMAAYQDILASANGTTSGQNSISTKAIYY